MTNSAAPPDVAAGEGGVTPGQLRVTAERAAAQLLSGPPAARAEDVAGRLLAIQGQDPRGARLAVRARTEGLSAADIDQALTVDRSLVISWLNRGTLHLVRSEDYWMLHRLTTPQLEAGCTRRLAQEGIPPAAAVTSSRSRRDRGRRRRPVVAGWPSRPCVARGPAARR